MKFDFWYGDCKKDVARITYSFSDVDCIWRGNMYNKDGKIIGDFSTTDSVKLQNFFKKGN